MKFICKDNVLIIFYIIIFSFVLTIQDIAFPLSRGVSYRDGAIYQYIGHLMLLGKHPYIDAFDHKGILLYFINAIGCSISYKWGIWLCDYLFMIGIIAFSYLIARQFLSVKRAMMVCTIVYIDFQYIYWIGNTPDYFAVFFESIALYLLILVYKETSREHIFQFIIGICVAACFWLKQTTIIPIVFMCFFVMTYKIIKAHSLLLKDVAFISGGFIFVSFIICIYHVYTGTWYEMLHDYFLFNFGYSVHDTSNNVLNVLSSYLLHSSTIIVIIVWFFYLFVAKGRIKLIFKENIFSILGLVSFLITMFLLAVPGRPYIQYFLICYPLMIITLSTSFDYVFNSLLSYLKTKNKYDSLIGKIVYIVCPVFLIASYIMSTTYTCIKNWGEDDVYAKIIYIIDNNCDSEDRIAVVSPHDCGLYLSSGNESATTFPYVQLLLYDDKSFVEAYNNQIIEKNPKIIIYRSIEDRDSFLSSEVLSRYDELAQINIYTLYLRN